MLIFLPSAISNAFVSSRIFNANMIWIAIILTLGALLFWELRVCEGAHLGRGFVVWLYNLTAKRYDGIKGFDFDWEKRILGEPITDILMGLPDARILDVGAGTGRLSRALMPQLNFRGAVISLEPSLEMLKLGRQHSNSDRAFWLSAFAVPLPFDEDTFDLVASLEVLEFTPDPEATLRELIRVLVPGGWLLVSNRVGWEAKWILGRTHPRNKFVAFLESNGFQNVRLIPWQVDYDLAWARKPFIKVH